MRYAVVHTYTGEVITRCDTQRGAVNAARFHGSPDSDLTAHHRARPLEAVDTEVHTTTSAGIRIEI